MKSWYKFVPLGFWYTQQGAAFALVGKVGLKKLSDADLSLWEVVFYSACVGWVWALKSIWGLAIDRTGHRLVWIFGGSFGIVFSLILFGFYPEPDPFKMLWIGSLCNFFLVIQDVAVDGLAASLMRGKRDEGIGQGVMWGSRAIGGMIGGGLLIQSSDLLSWSGQCWAVAGFAAFYGLVLPAVVVFKGALPELERPEATRLTEQSVGSGKFKLWLRGIRIGDHAVLILCIVTACAYIPASAFTYPIQWRVYKGIGFEDLVGISRIEMIGPWMEVIGAVLGALLVSKVSRRKGLWIATILLSLSTGLIGVLGLLGMWRPTGWMGTLFVLTNLTDSMYKGALFAFFYKVARQYRSRAAVFALIMSGTNFSGFWGKLVPAILVHGEGIPWFNPITIIPGIGYAGVYLFGAALQLVVVIPVIKAISLHESKSVKDED